MTETGTMAYASGKLLVSIVKRGHGEKLVALTKGAGARGGTVILGRGTAETSLLELLGIGDSEKDLVLTLASEQELGPIMDCLRGHACPDKRGLGVVMQLDVSHILRHVAAPAAVLAEAADTNARRTPMEARSGYELITFIVNRGYADDAMVAARKAGATGGTILNARGTGKEEDVKFFGITLVPEKEILLIVVESGRKEAILQAVKDISCLSEPGSGIAFAIEVEDFLTLGKGAGL